MKTYKEIKKENLVVWVSHGSFKKVLNELEENEEIKAMTQNRSGISNVFISNKRIIVRKNPRYLGMGDNLDIYYSEIEKNSIDSTLVGNLRFNAKGLQFVVYDENFCFHNLIKELIVEDEKRRGKVKQLEEKTKKWKEEGYKVDELEEMLEEANK